MDAARERVDRVFEALSHYHRRQVLLALRGENSGGNRDMAGLVEGIASEEDPEQVRVQMVHQHLPKLEEFGYVDWNRERGRVARGPEWTALEPFLGVIEDHSPELADETT